MVAGPISHDGRVSAWESRLQAAPDRARAVCNRRGIRSVVSRCMRAQIGQIWLFACKPISKVRATNSFTVVGRNAISLRRSRRNSRPTHFRHSNEMNKSFKTVWNDALGAWVATPEHQAARGKRSGSVAKAVLASAVGLAATTGAFAAGFDGGDVSQGTPGTAQWRGNRFGLERQLQLRRSLRAGRGSNGRWRCGGGRGRESQQRRAQRRWRCARQYRCRVQRARARSQRNLVGRPRECFGRAIDGSRLTRAGGGQREFRGRLRRQRGRG